MKVKDFSGNLSGVKVKTSSGVVGFWKSQWHKGVWLSDGKTSKVYPQFINGLSECLEWDIVGEAIPINCNLAIMRTSSFVAPNNGQ